MKSNKHFLILIFLFVFLTYGFGQSCLTEGITFSRQGQIDSFPINYPECFKIDGDITVKGYNLITNLLGLSQIDTILGNFVFQYNNAIKDFVGLENLKYIGKNFNIRSNSNLKNLNGLNNLSQIGGILEIYNNNLLNSLSGIDKIIVIGEGLDIYKNNSIYNLHGLENLLQINGYLRVNGNLLLKQLTGLKNLNSIFGNVSISFNYELVDFSGLENLNYIDGQLQIDHNFKLKSISALKNLTHLNGNLDIFLNDELLNLEGLNNLNRIGGYIRIENNKKINDISNLKKIDPYTVSSSILTYSDLIIVGNNSLTDCNLEIICEILATSGKSLEIHDNNHGCNSESEIDCNYNFIKGRVFYDYDKNKTFDANEAGISNLIVHIEPQNINLLTDIDGRFYYRCDSNSSYEISLDYGPDWKITTDSTTYNIVFDPKNPSNINLDFGLYPNFRYYSGSINITSNIKRCDNDSKLIVVIENTGSYSESGIIKLYLDPLININRCIPLYSEFYKSDNIIKWNYKDLIPLQSKVYEIITSFSNQNILNDSIYFYAEIYRDSSDIELLLDRYSLVQNVNCTFEPNDKIVNPIGVKEQNYISHDDILSYTIRFQNTGNTEITNIKILDTLDNNLDIETFKVISSSHIVQTSLKDNIVEFIFKNIYLPDSTTNEPASNGFVTYEIKSKEDVSDYTEIQNKAYIFFDFNNAIVTNATKNTIVTTIPVSTVDLNQNSIIIYPNPAANIIHILNSNNTQIYDIKVFDAFGREIICTNHTSLDISDFTNGLYILRINLNGRIITKKVVVNN